MKRIPIVWVEIGRKIPRHLKRNILFHSSSFPERQQFLITDQRVSKRIRRICNVIDVKSLSNLAKEDYLDRELNRSTMQRQFWINTTRRFFVIQAFMDREQLEEVIHLESDCILIEPNSLDIVFNEINWSLAYPMQADGVGCASILLLRGVSGIKDFNSLVKANWGEENQDDMKLLGKFATNPQVRILPTTPGAEIMFDPQIFGRYLLGTDARNNRFPFSRRGIVDDRLGASNPENYSYRWSDNSHSLIIDFCGSFSRLVNIHIHSKRVPKNWRQLDKTLGVDVKRIGSKKWKRGKFDSQVFTERLVSWLSRKVLKRSIDYRLR